MDIKDICKKNVMMVPLYATLRYAATVMKNADVGSVVVVQEQKGERIPVGIVTDRDIVIKALAENANLSEVEVLDVMCKDLVILEDDEDIYEALSLMERYAVRRAPVVNEDGDICGIVTLDDLLVLIIRELSKLAGTVAKQISH